MAKNSKNKLKTQPKSSLSLEIICIASICISILLIISIYFNGGGVIGTVFASILKGLFGIGSYIAPFFIITSCFVVFFSEKKKINSFKFVSSLIIVLLTMSFMHLIKKDTLNLNPYSTYLLNIYKSGSLFNGGVLGALIGDLLSSILGKTFTYILIIFSIIILAVLLSGKSFFKFMEDIFHKIKNYFYYEYTPNELSENNFFNTIKEFFKKIKPKPKVNSVQKTKLEEIPLNISEALEPLEPLKNIEYAKNQVEIDNYIFYGESKYKKIEKPTILTLKKDTEKTPNKKISFAIDEIKNSTKIPNFSNVIKPETPLFNITKVEPNTSETHISNTSSHLETPSKTENFFLQKEQIERAKNIFNTSIIPEEPNTELSDFQNIISSEVIFDYDIPTHLEIEQLFNKPPELFLSDNTDFTSLDKLNEFYDFEKNIEPSENINSHKNFSESENKLQNNINISSKLNNTSNNKEQIQNPAQDIQISEDSKKHTEPNTKEPYIEKAEKQKFVTKLNIDETAKKSSYEFPKLEFLNKNPNLKDENNDIELKENSNILVKTLKSFNVNSNVVKISKGPSVTRYELSIEDGIKVSKILGLDANLALSLAATSIRIEAPIPGKSAVGIEIPNKEVKSVFLSEVICEEKFQNFNSKVSFGIGKDITGNVIVTDIAKMPHMLIAGATGSGKSVCINTLITSILYKATPEDVRLIMIDPKVVELSVYNQIPHLLLPVVTEPEKASGTLNWAVQEMMDRYNLFAETGVRNLTGYNEIMLKNGQAKLPQIIIIIDELADLMMVAAKEVENAICRLAQLARAAGMHLIIATQRPSVDVITGLIKANIPSRIAFAVSSGTDSRTILDSVGAEKLLGKGDMLFKSVDMSKPLRIQGAFISDKEVETIVNFIKSNSEPNYDPNIINKIDNNIKNTDGTSLELSDELTEEVIAFLVRKGKASTSLIQRQFRIGYNRAARIIEELEDRGIISPENGSKQRDVLMDKYQFEDYLNRQNDY